MVDHIDSEEFNERALNISKESVHHLHLGGFKLNMFANNVRNMANQIVGSPQSTEPRVNASSVEESLRVLWLKWDHNKDTLFVSRVTCGTVTTSLTKRLELSLVSKVFGPIFLVAPFTVGARLRLIEIWRVRGQHLDEEQPKDTVEGFLEWSAELPKKSLYRADTSRETLNTWNYTCFAIVCKNSSVLFHFSFSSKYLECNTKGACVCPGKARVAPMKLMTIPKLKLQTALFAARLKKDLCGVLTVNVDMIFMFWCGPTVLLSRNGLSLQPGTQYLLQIVF